MKANYKGAGDILQTSPEMIADGIFVILCQSKNQFDQIFNTRDCLFISHVNADDARLIRVNDYISYVSATPNRVDITTKKVKDVKTFPSGDIVFRIRETDDCDAISQIVIQKINDLADGATSSFSVEYYDGVKYYRKIK